MPARSQTEPWQNQRMEASQPPIEGDALGAALLAHLDEGEAGGLHVVERDDGYVNVDSAGQYFSVAGGWFPVEEGYAEGVHGRVLDIGAGAGRFSVDLQNRGHQVVALDVSGGCLEVCRRQGVLETFHGTIFDMAGTDPEPFDTFLLMGHNIGLLGSPATALQFLRTLGMLANPGATIIGTTREPLATSDPQHLAYHQMNRDRGRPPGQLTIRVRWQHLATPWFDYWFVSTDELTTLATASGWRLVDQDYKDGSYLARLELSTRL